MKSLEERFYSHLSPSLMHSVVRVIESAPFTLACLCILLLPFAGALLFSIAYILTFLYGVFSGHPFPSREFFLFFPSLVAIFSHPSALAKALLAYAFAGAVLSVPLRREQEAKLGRNLLNAIGRKWTTLSFLIIFSLLLGTLGEHYYSYNTDYNALAGILPYSDAYCHYTHYTRYFYDGVMGDWTLRRPMAAFMGATIHWLAGNDPASSLLLRCVLVSFAMWASCACMNKSFGVWSAIGCLALEYAYIGKYLHTFLTEPLGFFWGCTAVALWLQALREDYLFWDLAALSATLAGLLTRMGAMFLVPALFLYVLCRWRHVRPGRGWWKKPLLGLCICVMAIGLLNTVFSSRGEGDHQQTGSNFSSCFAGLTLGTNWAGPYKQYAQELSALKDEKQISKFFYKQGVKNILHSPGVFFKRLAQGEVEFLKNINFFLFHNWCLVWLMAGLLALRRKTLFSKSFAAFWIATWGAILISIPFIYFDDSWRVNIFVYPFVACFFSLALGRPQLAEKTPTGRSSSAPWLAVGLSTALLLLMTSVALFPRLHTPEGIQRIQKYKASLPKRAPNSVLVGANGMGVLVVPDDETPPVGVPGMTWSTFKDRYRKFSSIDGAFFGKSFPKPPFTILSQSPLIGPPHGDGYFLTPPYVLTQQDVLLWDFETDGEIKDASRGIPWKIVTKAKPILYK